MNINFEKLQKEVDLGSEKLKARVSKVKDKRAAPIQTTAEQIIRIASDHQERYVYRSQQKIEDKEELEEYLKMKRSHYEKNVAKNPYSYTNWFKYAFWESKMGYYERARSIFERCLEVEYRNKSIWLKYADMEIRNKFINHARNVYDRAVEYLPREDTLWFKYVYMEESLGNIVGAQRVFNRWLKWLPGKHVFKSYINMLKRYKKFEECEEVIEKMILLHNEASSYHYYAKFEYEINGNIAKARKIYETGIKELSKDLTLLTGSSSSSKSSSSSQQQKSEGGKGIVIEVKNQDLQVCDLLELYIKFAEFEENNKEFARCRIIYKFSLEQVLKKYEQEKEKKEKEDLLVLNKRNEQMKDENENENVDQYERKKKEEELKKEREGVLKLNSLRNRIYQRYIEFEKRHGNQEDIEKTIVEKRRKEYENRLKETPQDYDLWFDYIQLEEDVLKILMNKKRQQLMKMNDEDEDEDNDDDDDDDDDEKEDNTNQLSIDRLMESSEEVKKQVLKIEDLYEQSISKLPPVEEKKYWKKYIYFWIKYAIFEELILHNIEKTRSIFQNVMMVIPMKKFHFSKIIIMYGQFELRQHRISETRRIYGQALGRTPSKKLFEEYIKMELLISNVDRVRKLYQKYIEFGGSQVEPYISYAKFESKLREYERCRGIFRFAISQMDEIEGEGLDTPEELWKSFIDFEISLGMYDNARTLYRNLLERTKHVKVWISFAEFEFRVNKDHKKCREVFIEANKYFKNDFYNQSSFFNDEEEDQNDEQGNVNKPKLPSYLKEERREIERKEQRYALLLKWLEIEKEIKHDSSINKEGKEDEKNWIEHVESMIPEKIKRKRKIVNENGNILPGFEEFYDFIFKDEVKTMGEGESEVLGTATVDSSKILEVAKKWKKKKEQERKKKKMEDEEK